MQAAFRPGPRTLAAIARTGEAYASFGPYVPAMGEDGRVAFQATLSYGMSGVFVVDEGGDRPLGLATIHDDAGSVVSHPDVWGSSACFYAHMRGHAPRLYVLREGRALEVAADGCGPLGPTMAGERLAAYRDTADGVARVCVWHGDRLEELDRAGGDVAGFEGLPVVSARGDVVWRVNLADGGHEIRLRERGAAPTRAVASTGSRWSSLGRFPMVSAGGVVVFAGAEHGRGDGLFVWRGGLSDRVAGDGFDSIRGGLIGDDGTLFVIGTPRGGGLGVFADAEGREPIVQVGTPLLGSCVSELALNPVSVNGARQVAVRVGLAHGFGAILRSDSAG